MRIRVNMPRLVVYGAVCVMSFYVLRIFGLDANPWFYMPVVFLASFASRALVGDL